MKNTSTDFLKNLGKNVQKLRTQKGLEIEELSKLLGINISYLKKIEEGFAKGIKLSHLEKFTSGLGVNLKNLLE